MYIVLAIVSLLAGIIGVISICVLYRNSILKKRNGKIITGKKISCEELIGRPTRYIVEVECKINDHTDLRKIVTTDKKIKKYDNDEEMPLLYVDTTDKIYWAEDNSHEKIVSMVLLAFFCAFMFLLSVISLLKI
ncbi:MAG: hypothetical protein HDR00_11595 [Lachnospiraceae bacterium]|nr:hypothetical protein [Lachnospiraceae bacterium]